MTGETLQLPPNWVEIKLGDIIELAYGKGLPKESRNTDGKYPVYGSNGIVGYHNQCLITGPAIIVGRKGAAGIPTYAREDCWPIDTTYFIQPKNVYDLSFVYYLIRHLRLDQFDRSTAIPGLNRDDAYALRIGLPPLNEQKRIVAKIEELFSELDKGIENLKTAREQLKVYRQAVLKHAFEGKLTAHWREQNKDKLEPANQLLERIKRERETHYQQQLKEYAATIKSWEKNGSKGKKPSKPRAPEKPDKPNPEHLQKLWVAPETWQWVQIGDFAFVTKLAGFEYTDYVKYDDTGDLPVIKAENAGLHGFKPTNYSRVHSSAVSHLKRSHLMGGEILVVFVGAGTGNVAMVPNDQNFFLGPNVGMIRPESDVINSRYIEFFLRSPMGKDMILATVKAVAQPSISMGTIRQTPVILPSLLEQEEIVKRLTKNLSYIDCIEDEIEVNLQKSEALRQSILNKAFSGKLVAQDPNDEPASLLLERIRAEKEAQKTESKNPKTKRNAA